MANVKEKKAEVIIIGRSAIEAGTCTQENALALEKAGSVILQIAGDFSRTLTKTEFEAFQAEAADHVLFLSKMQRLLDDNPLAPASVGVIEEDVAEEDAAEEEALVKEIPKVIKAKVTKAKAAKTKAAEVAEPAEEPADGKDALARALDLIGCPVLGEEEDTSEPAEATKGSDTKAVTQEATVSSSAAERLAKIRAKAQG